jgi:threonine dehydrogenase-like Zn-dependent dehydrogenase
MAGGGASARQFVPLLKKLIESGRASPSFVFSEEVNIEEALAAYRLFSEHESLKAAIHFDNVEAPHANGNGHDIKKRKMMGD